MKLSLLKGKDIFSKILPDKPQGQYWIEYVNDAGHEEKLIRIEGLNNEWHIKSNKIAKIIGESGNVVKECIVNAGEVYRIQFAEREMMLIHVEEITEDRQIFKKINLPSSGKITFGRSATNDIQYQNKYVSSQHAEIYIEQNNYRLKNLSKSNGTYVNNIKIDEVQLKPGDVITIIGFKCIVGNGFISINNPDQSITYNTTVFKPYKKSEIIEEQEIFEDLEEFEPTVFNTYFRSPRFKREAEQKEFKIDSPPAPNNKEETPLLLMLGPSITMGIASIVTAIFTLQYALKNNGNMRFVVPTIAMSVSMLIGTIVFPIIMRKHERKKREKHEKLRQEKYREYLNKMEQRIAEDALLQTEVLRENYETVTQCTQYIHEQSTNLWERTIHQKDFLTLRLGTGNVKHDVVVKYPEERFTIEDDDLQDYVQQLAAKEKVLENVPVTLPLQKHKSIGIVGTKVNRQRFAKSLLMQLVSLHSYDELKLVFLFDKNDAKQWGFVKWLPHVWNKENDIRFTACEVNDVRELNSYLDKELQRRKEVLKNGKEKLTSQIVVFALDRALSLKADVFNAIYAEEEDVQMNVLHFMDGINKLPKETSIVVNLEDQTGEIFNKHNVTGDIQRFIPEYYDANDEYALTRKLANIRMLDAESNFVLPERITFLELFEVGMIEHLNPLNRWQQNDPTLSLQARIGVGTDGDWATLDLHEKFHGPHGLIAGMTGSGKSEFIMTYILSLAINYHPEEVSFILIDYKGGGMASAFTKLPHLAGTITNLDGRAVNRSLVSIQSELKRRQKLFNDAGRALEISNIDIYKYQKLYREGRVEEPLSHLFIISDEFAELKTQQPEFMTQLISAARIGRSLGIHLILATQKPSGVVDDQIWSNTKFRVSLKVQERADSMDVIKRPDAAELTLTGRYYLSVGYNELFELGQSAWSGAPYYPTEKVEKSVDNGIVIIDQLGRNISEYKPENRMRLHSNPPKQIDEIVKYLELTAKEENIDIRPIWLNPIEEFIYLNELIEKYNFQVQEPYALQAIIGEYDDPENQLQDALIFDLNNNGNTIIYGSAGSGKATFITTLLTSYIQTKTPEEVNFYVLDFGAETLRAFNDAPHVGEVLTGEDQEKIQNLFKMLNKEMANRKKDFANFGGDYASYVRSGNTDKAQIVVMINNYANFTEIYHEYEEFIAVLAREGTKYGIYFIITATNGSAIRYRISQNFKQVYVLQLNDDADYTGILGNINGVYPTKYKGRGIFKNDGVFEFQTAYAFENVDFIFDVVRQYCTQANEAWNGPIAPKIPVLPKKVDVSNLKATFNKYGRYEYPIGIDKQQLVPVTIDLEEETILYVSGNEVESSTFMQGLAEIIAEKGTSEVVYVDCGEGLVGELPEHFEVVTDNYEAFVLKIYHIMVERNNTYKDMIAANNEPPVYPDITIVIQSFTNFLQKLDSDRLEKFKLVLEKGELHYNLRFVIADNVNHLSSYSFDAWFKARLSLKNVIWLGNGVAEQYQIPTKTSTQLRQEIPEDFGYKLVNGKGTLIKLVSSQYEEVQELMEV